MPSLMLCQCQVFEASHCARPASQEDLLCDDCRQYKTELAEWHRVCAEMHREEQLPPGSSVKGPGHAGGLPENPVHTTFTIQYPLQIESPAEVYVGVELEGWG